MIAINQTAHEFLSTWLKDLPSGLKKIHINNLCFDSRQVQPGDAFVAMPSVAGNEAQYVSTSVENGAVLILAQQEVSVPKNVALHLISDLVPFIGNALHDRLGRVCDKMLAIGITGTNGKSSISFYLAQLLNQLNNPCAVMGTLGYGDWQSLTETGMTTLPVDKLHQTLAKLSNAHTAIAMEVSSHGLEQGRLAGVEFKGAIFSNLTRDHLDYHGTMEAYGLAKAALFQWPSLDFTVINFDDDYSDDLIQLSTCKNIIGYGQSEKCHLKFNFDKIHNQGMTVVFCWQDRHQSISLPLYGEFNAYNVAAAVACAIQMGFDFNSVILALSAIRAVPGRMQLIKSGLDQPLVLVDYAHTPDALQQALLAAKAHSPGDVHLVVGCGGDRDQGKRTLMGEIAVKYADKVTFTSDNPRSESPKHICLEMTQKLDPSLYDIMLDRKQAITRAVSQAKAGDLVLVAGKGHENYQEINGQRLFFSDEQAAQEALLLGNEA
jgi:UDP-N-acetylmuramoyl-L-alanyl-D-glutamate--2,6-diaminopimelate ligase